MSAEVLIKNEQTAPQVVPAPPHRLPGVLDNPQVRVGLLAATALVVEPALARTVLHVELNFFALLAPFFIFTAYKVSGERGRAAEIVASMAVVVATAVVLLVYAF